MNLEGKTIAVTGATGFLGRYIVQVLQARGAKVIGVVRNPDRVPELKASGVELRKADLADRAALTEGFRGAAAVVSNAALFSLRSNDLKAYLKSNVEGTRNVFEAVAAAGVRRVVQISSVAVYANKPAWKKIDEDWPQHTEQSKPGLTKAYKVSKALSEQEAWRQAAKHGLELTTLRPCGIYGAYDRNLTRIVGWLLSVPLATLVPAYLQLPFVYAGDVAEGVALSLERPQSVGRAYNLTGDDVTFWDFVKAWREAGGKAPPLKLPVPAPGGQWFDHSRAERELGWRNRPYVEGLRETFVLQGGHGGLAERRPPVSPSVAP